MTARYGLLASIALGGCAHDSLWRIQIDGMLMKDGVEIERFFGRDIDRGYREGDTPSLWVPDWKVTGETAYHVQFELPDHRVLADLEEGTYGSAIGSERRRMPISASLSGPGLGLSSLGEKTDGDFGADHYVDNVVFEIKKNRNGGLFGVFTGEFSDGYSLVDAEFEMRGFGDPRDAKPDDDSTYGTYGTGGGCSSFNDTTPYYGDVQADSFCWAAGLYEACGDPSAASSSCATLDQLLESGTGSLGTCPYC